MNPREVRLALIKLGVFTVVAAVVLVTILATIRPFGASQGRTTYTADFTSASKLAVGDDVRVAGVPVGVVRSITLTPANTARVDFSLDTDLPITTRTSFQIRYLDLAGNRYVAATEPASGRADRQPADRPIGTDRTSPALDIDELLSGFKPLLTGLSPHDLNAFTLDLIQTLQGDGGTIRSLITHVGSLTGGLAQRNQLVLDVVAHLNGAVGDVASQHTQLEQLVHGLRVFSGSLSHSRNDVGQAITHIDQMASLTTQLLAQSRPALRDDLATLGSITEVLASPSGQKQLEHALDHLPDKLARLMATAGYGSFFNYYVCGIRVRLAQADGVAPAIRAAIESAHVIDTAARCR